MRIEFFRKNPKKILVIRPGGLGDMLMITPSIRGLKRRFPKAEVWVAARPRQLELLFHNPNVNGLLRFNRKMRSEADKEFNVVVDFYEHVERNPEADCRNPYRIACEFVGVPQAMGPPDYFPTRVELSVAKAILASVDVVPGRDQIVLMHNEASAPIRRIPPQLALEIATRFAKKDFKVVFVATKDPFESLSEELHPNIVSLHQEVQAVKPRVMFCLPKLGDLFVGVDSAFSHFAAAFGTRSVVLYGSYAGSTRVGAFPNIHVLQSNAPCGPCHQHRGFCVRFGREIPPCMSLFSPERVCAVGLRLLSGETPKRPVRTYLHVRKVRACPMCGHTANSPFARKGAYLYRTCRLCGTLFTHKLPPRDESLPPTAKLQSLAGKRLRPLPAKAFAEFLAAYPGQIGVQHPRLLAMNRLPRAVARTARAHGWTVSQPRMKERSERPRREPPELSPKLTGFDAAIILESFLELRNPLEALARAFARLRPHGMILLAWHCPDSVTENRRKYNWHPLNPVVAGRYLSFPSVKGVSQAAKSRGLESEAREIPEAHRGIALLWKPH